MTAPSLRRRVYLGVDLDPIDAAGGGALVAGVRPDGPAAQAGVRADDVIVRLGSALIGRPGDVVRALREVRRGTRIDVEVHRGGQHRRFAVDVRPLPLESAPIGEIVLDEVPTPSGRWRALLSLPDRGAIFPAVYLLKGADWSSCEHPFEPRAPWRRLAEELTRAGFATYRVERSGVGDSEGPPCTDVDFESELAGFLAGARRLESLPIVSSVHLFGHSLGGMLAPLVAREVEVRSIAVCGASQRRFSDCIRATGRRSWERAGLGPGEVAENSARLEQELEAIDDPSPASGARLYGRIVQFFRQLDRAPLHAAWREVRCPVLALHGELDWITTVAEAREIAPDETLSLASMRHDLTDARTADLSHELVEQLVRFYRPLTF